MTEKYLALYHKIYELSYTVLRYSNVYGPRQGADGEGGVIYIFAKSLAENKPITIFGDGQQTRDFISVHDVVSANLAALHQADGEIINVSTETELSLNDLASKMIAAAGRSRKLLHYGSPRTGDIYRSCLSNQKSEDTAALDSFKKHQRRSYRNDSFLSGQTLNDTKKHFPMQTHEQKCFFLLIIRDTPPKL